MTDLITRARKEWVEAQKTIFPVVNGFVYTQELHCPCPPEVVAALLDLKEFVAAPIITCRCIACEIRRKQQLLDLIAAVDAAIARALEGKP